jgi:penicillin amidase
MKRLSAAITVAALVAPVAVTSLGLVGAPARQENFETLARASLAQLDGRVTLPGLRDSVEVIRDRWGVPHIYARNTEDLLFAQGFVHAQDRLWQMEMYRRTFEGKLSEMMSPNDNDNDNDSNFISRPAARWMESQV